MRIWALVSMTLLAGCAGPAMNSARQAGPVQVLGSDKDPRQVAECIQFSWQVQRLFGATTDALLDVHDADRYTVYTIGGTHFVDVQKGPGEVAVKFYSQNRDDTSRRRLATVATCL